MGAVYRHFGLVVESEWPLPLDHADIDARCVDVRVFRGEVLPRGRELWRSQVGLASVFYDSGDHHVLDVGSARFAITRDRIIIDASDTAVSTQFLLFPAWSAMLALRGHEPLHGAVVERAGQGFALFGEPGSGKSTGCLMLIDRGWRLVTDDLIAFDDAGNVIPGPPFMRLRDDRAADRDGAPDGAGKFRFTPPLADAPVPLTGAVVFSQSSRELRKLTSTEAVQALLATPYNAFSPHSSQALARFRSALEIARRTPIHAAPLRSLTPDQLVALAGEPA